MSTPTIFDTQPALPENPLSELIFKLDKTDYENTPLFFGQAPGLFDSINKQQAEIWRLYKHQKSLDWSEDEYDYRQCLIEFERADPRSSTAMIENTGWQWEGDSIASRSIMAVLAPVISSSELKIAYERVVDNENLHALTYSEITRMSFRDPSIIMNKILSIRQSHDRLLSVGTIFTDAWRFSAWYNYQLAQGIEVQVTQDMYNKIFMYIVALFVFERVQFMSSFATTFAYGEEGEYLPIAKAIRRICQDEFEVHVQLAMAVLRVELRTERGKTAFKECRELIVRLINEVHGKESDWNHYIWRDGFRKKYLDLKGAQAFTDFSAYAPAQFFGVEAVVDIPRVTENPLAYFNNWVDISKNQASPQEEQNDQYKVNVLRENDQGKVYSQYRFL